MVHSPIRRPQEGHRLRRSVLVSDLEQLDPSPRPGPDQTRKLVAPHLFASLPKLERGPRSQGVGLLGNLRKPAGGFEDGGRKWVMGLSLQNRTMLIGHFKYFDK